MSWHDVIVSITWYMRLHLYRTCSTLFAVIVSLFVSVGSTSRNRLSVEMRHDAFCVGKGQVEHGMRGVLRGRSKRETRRDGRGNVPRGSPSPRGHAMPPLPRSTQARPQTRPFEVAPARHLNLDSLSTTSDITYRKKRRSPVRPRHA